MPESLTDGEIIDAVLAGQRDRFGILVRRYEPSLLRLAASRLGRRDWAEEAVQEAFFSAFRSLHAYDSRYSFRTWLWTILLNQCNRQYHKQHRAPQPSDAVARSPSLASDELAPSTRLLIKERNEHLESVLQRLPAQQADALRLRFFGGLKFHEIADAMGCSLSTAKNRVRWGLLKMNEMMSPRPDGCGVAVGEPR